MKLTNAIKVPVMLAVMGCGLMLAKPAAAQEEIDPTHFDEGPSMVPFNQPVNPAPVAEATMISANTSASNESQPTQVSAQNSAAAGAAWAVPVGLGAMLLVGTVMIVGEDRRRAGHAAGATASDSSAV